MARRDIIAIGGSAGGLQALLELLATIPSDLQAAIFVVVHTAPEGAGLLPDILSRSGVWAAAYAKDAERIELRRIYVAPPDHHLLVKRDHVRVVHGPRENRFRPAVDPLFRTAARAYGARVIGIVLSGSLDDGTHGLELIKRHGGVGIAQDPEEALMPGMPLSAIQKVEVDHILPARLIGIKLVTLVRQQVEDLRPPVPESKDVTEGRQDNMQTGHVPGPPSPFVCPECGGALWELEEGKLLRFRCHVGHGYTADALFADQGEHLEQTLWSALRALEEQAALRRRMAQHAEHIGRLDAARQFEVEAKDSERRAGTMRRMLLREESPAEETVPDTPAVESVGREEPRARLRDGRR
jgi:two-component system, chemotaxis family, protein-glutamate methylesterase/glutaminase